MSVFITGAAGYIGSRLALKLAENGQHVTALFRNSVNHSLKGVANIRIVQGDILSKDSLAKGMENCDKVFHLAALAAPWAKDKSLFHRINVQGAMNVFEAAKKSGVAKVVFTSTAGTLGPQQSSEPINERQQPAFVFTDYERSKTLAEEQARQYFQKGLNIVTVNPTRVFGPGPMSKSNAVTYIISRYLEGKWKIIPGNGQSVGNYVYVEDVVNGHLLAMDKGRPGERYLIGGENVSFDELFLTIAEVMEKKVRLYKLPVAIMMTAAYASMAYSKFTGQPPIITPPWVNRYMHHWAVSTEKAKRELGYAPMSLNEGIKKTVDWLRQIT